jgi:hypothetical protein
MNHFVQQQMSILRNYIDILRNTYYGFVIRLTRQVSLVEQELLTLPENLSSPPAFSGICVTQSLIHFLCSVRLYLQLFVGVIMSCLRYFCLFPYSGVQHILSCVFALFFFDLCTLCCHILWNILFDSPFYNLVTV